LLIFSVFAHSESKTPASAKSTQAPKVKKSALKAKLPPTEQVGAFGRTYLRANKSAAGFIDRMGHQADIFLSGERYVSKRRKKNKSTVTLKNAAYWVEGKGDDIDYSTQVDVRLLLPHLEDKWSLRFTSYDEDEDERGINRKRPKTTPRRENYGTSIAVLQKLGDVDITFRPRVQLKNGLETSHLLKLESGGEVRGITVVPRLELFARPEVGTGQLFALDFGYALNNALTFFVSNEQEYVDYENKLSTNHELAVIHSFEEDKSLKYAVLFQSDNQPKHFHLREYVFYTSYTHAFYQDQLHYNITPRVGFNEDNSFRPKGGLLLALDLIF